MSDLVRKQICEGVTFDTIQDNRFKAGRLNIKLITPLSRKTAAENALLACVLTRSCKKYPDFTSLYRRLNELYGAALFPAIRKVGDFQVISLLASGLDDRYALKGESVSSELAELLCSILFEPKLVNGCFDEEDVEQERRQILEQIDSEFNDKRGFAIKRCIEIMCRDELYSVNRYGGREEVLAITQDDLVSAWKRLLDNAAVSVMKLGGGDPQGVYEKMESRFAGKPRRIKGATAIVSNVSEVKRAAETDEISQSKLVMGYRCKYPESNRECVANSLMSVILGGAPTSKLFLNVREKQSLCYYCASMADNEKGILLIDSGVETDKIEKTEKAVTEQVELLKSGDLTDDELIHAKLLLKNAYISSLDSLGAMDSYYAARALRESPASPQESAEIAESITRNEILELASCIKLDTVFSLVGN